MQTHSCANDHDRCPGHGVVGVAGGATTDCPSAAAARFAFDPWRPLSVTRQFYRPLAAAWSGGPWRAPGLNGAETVTVLQAARSDNAPGTAAGGSGPAAAGGAGTPRGPLTRGPTPGSGGTAARDEGEQLPAELARRAPGDETKPDRALHLHLGHYTNHRGVHEQQQQPRVGPADRAASISPARKSMARCTSGETPASIRGHLRPEPVGLSCTSPSRAGGARRSERRCSSPSPPARSPTA